ncbi:MAG: pilus assembly protein TadG-related protein [Actinomycetota bacterium]|nr:pilus assembly protein TadG-related protein [Actinomycetota bacterium]
MLAIVVVLTAMAAGVTVFAGLAAAKHRATAAADLAALAAASTGSGGCEVAARTAGGNGARLTGCTPAGLDVTVTVEVEAEYAFGLHHVISARARAGPAR